MPTNEEFNQIIDDGKKRLEELRQERNQLSKEEAARRQPEFEREVHRILDEVKRELTREDLQRLDTDVPGVVIDGIRHRRKGRSNKEYLSLAGPIKVERTVYVPRGGSGGRSVALVDLSVGMVGGWTPLAAEVASRYLEAVTPRKAAVLLAQHGGMTPSAAHLDRLPKAFNDLWEPRRVELEQIVRDNDEWPEDKQVAAIAFSLDGIMLGMKGAPRSGTSEGPHGHREAYCATVFLLDAEGERVKTLRYGRAPESKKVTLHQWLDAELKAARARYPGRPFYVVADGAEENWRIVGELALSVGVKIVRALDFFHLAEHLSDALKARYGARSGKVKAILKRWTELLKTNPHGPRRVIKELGGMVEGAPNEEARNSLERELAYVRRHHKNKMLRYAWLREQNLPIGSGIQEAACRTLVAERLKLSGMTWAHPGAQGVLTLRSLEQSGRLGPAWEALLDKVLRRPFDIDTSTRRKRPEIRPC